MNSFRAKVLPTPLGWLSRLEAWVVIVLAVTAIGCGGSEPETRRPLTVFAASSLTEAFVELAERYEAEHTDVDVRLVFAGTQALRMQIEHGAPADVFAAADERHMEALARSDRVGRPVIFAENTLVMIAPRRHRAGHPRMERFSDLARAERIVLGDPSVPVGRYARAALARARQSGSDGLGAAFTAEVMRHVVSEEPNTRLVRAKVELGEADAALVYATDATPTVRTIDLPPSLRLRARYPVATLSRSDQRTAAARFVAFLRSAEARRVLGEYGFLAPSTSEGELSHTGAWTSRVDALHPPARALQRDALP